MQHNHPQPNPNSRISIAHFVAFAGVFQAVVAGKAAKEDLRDVLAMVKHTGNPQVEYMTRVIRKWAKEANVKIS